MLSALSLCASAMGDYFNDHPEALAGDLQAFYFDALQFAKVAELFNEHFIFDITKRSLGGKRSSSILCLRNVVPAEFIRPRLTAARSSVLFSATLSPRHYYADLLGLPADTAWVDVASPFKAEQLRVRIVDEISTRFVHREASVGPIVELIAQQFAQQPVTTWRFFPASITSNKWRSAWPNSTRISHCGSSHGAWPRLSARAFSTSSPNIAKGWGSPCSAARLARVLTCPARA